MPSRILALLLSILLMPTLTFASGYAGSGTQSTDEQTAIRRALDELEQRRLEVDALKSSIKARDDQITALNAIIAQQGALIEQWKAAAEARHEANTSDDSIKRSYEDSVKKYDAELKEVRAERDSARRMKWLFGFSGAVLGAVIAVLGSRH